MIVTSIVTICVLAVPARGGPLGQRAPVAAGTTSTAVGTASRPSSARCPGARKGLLFYRDRTHHHQDQRGAPRTRYGQAHRSPGCAYVAWAGALWRDRAALARHRTERWLASVNWAMRDWWHAVLYANRVWPGSKGWLLACSSSEGGHGRFVMNRQGSGAGGWLQFMRGTFEAYGGSAFAEAKRRGHHVPASARSWYSPLGQAVTGAHMWSRGLTFHWVGARC